MYKRQASYRVDRAGTVESVSDDGGSSGDDETSGLDMEIGADGVAHDWKALSDMTVSAYWDGESDPAVWSTLGGFFASQTGLNEYESLPMGVLEDGTLYANWYMPYENGGKITIGNDGDEDYSITYTMTTAPLDAEKASELMRFHEYYTSPLSTRIRRAP